MKITRDNVHILGLMDLKKLGRKLGVEGTWSKTKYTKSNKQELIDTILDRLEDQLEDQNEEQVEVPKIIRSVKDIAVSKNSPEVVNEGIVENIQKPGYNSWIATGCVVVGSLIASGIWLWTQQQKPKQQEKPRTRVPPTTI